MKYDISERLQPQCLTFPWTFTHNSYLINATRQKLCMLVLIDGRRRKCHAPSNRTSRVLWHTHVIPPISWRWTWDHHKSTLCYLDATAIVHQPEFASCNNMKPQYPASDWNTTILRFTAATMADIFTFDSFIIASLVVPAVVALDPHVAVLLPLQSSQPWYEQFVAVVLVFELRRVQRPLGQYAKLGWRSM
jgi:hypothetical protein